MFHLVHSVQDLSCMHLVEEPHASCCSAEDLAHEQRLVLYLVHTQEHMRLSLSGHVVQGFALLRIDCQRLDPICSIYRVDVVLLCLVLAQGDCFPLVLGCEQPTYWAACLFQGRRVCCLQQRIRAGSYDSLVPLGT